MTPPLLTDVFALLTELGGVAFLVVFLSVLYWVGDRESTGTVISYTLVGLAVVLTLKAAFGLPRPPADVRAIAVDADSHGYPSGHAIASTVVYGGLLLTRGRVRDWRVAIPTVGLIGLVGLSRVVIGVHYLGDILAGYAVGLAILGGLWVTVGHRAHLACLAAAAVSAVGIVVTGGGSYALLGLGGSLGGAVAFWWTDRRALPHASDPLRAGGFVLAGLAGAGGVFLFARTVPIAPLAVLANAVLVGGIVCFPRVLELGNGVTQR